MLHGFTLLYRLNPIAKDIVMLETNQNKPERILRILISLVLLPAPFVLEPTGYTWGIAAVGGILLFNGLSGTCLTYKVLGVNTCELSKK